MTELSVTEGSLPFVPFFEYFTSLVLTLIRMLFILLSSKEHAFTITLFIRSHLYCLYEIPDHNLRTIASPPPI